MNHTEMITAMKSLRSASSIIQSRIDDVIRNNEFWRARLSMYLNLGPHKIENYRKTYLCILSKINLVHAFGYAARFGHLDIIELLIYNHVNPSCCNNHAIRIASEYGYLNVVRLLLQDRRVNSSSNISSLIQLAITHGHIDVLDELLKHNNANIMVDYSEAIDLAQKYGHYDMIFYLHKINDNSISPNVVVENAIISACQNGLVEILNTLLQERRFMRGESRPGARCAAFRIACEMRHINVLKLLFEHDERNALGSYIPNQIVFASRQGHTDVVSFLLLKI